MEELIKQLEQSLGNLQINKQAHIQIEQIMKQFKDKVDKIETSDKDTTKPKKQ